MRTSADPVAVALEYIEAVGRKDFDRVASLLHTDLEFQMPGKTMNGAAEYLGALKRLGAILERNDVKATLVDGNDVCVVYDFVTDTAVGAVPSVEWLTLEEGRIRTVRLIFHKERWPQVLAELRNRVAVSPN
jgi:SnoaL-like protein